MPAACPCIPPPGGTVAAAVLTVRASVPPPPLPTDPAHHDAVYISPPASWREGADAQWAVARAEAHATVRVPRAR